MSPKVLLNRLSFIVRRQYFSRHLDSNYLLLTKKTGSKCLTVYYINECHKMWKKKRVGDRVLKKQNVVVVTLFCLTHHVVD